MCFGSPSTKGGMHPGVTAPHFPHNLFLEEHANTPTAFCVSLTPLTLLLSHQIGGGGRQDVTPAGHQLRQRNLLKVLLHQKESCFLLCWLFSCSQCPGSCLCFKTSKVFPFFLKQEFSTMKTSTQITPDPCNPANRSNMASTCLLKQERRERSEKGLSWREVEGPPFQLSVLKVESVTEIW